MTRVLWCLALFLNLFPALGNDIQLSGFGTLGISLSDSSNYGFRSDIGSEHGVFSGQVDIRTNSLIGGQLEAKISDTLDFVGQVVYRDLSKPRPLDYLTMAFLRYSPSAKWHFRAGRLSPDLFMITEYRNINVAYTWANVPNEVYGMIPFRYFDGGDVTYVQRFEGATANIKVFTGVSDARVASSLGSEPIKLNQMIGAAFTFDRNDWNIQARYTSATINSNSSFGELLKQNIAQIPGALWPNKQEIYQQLTLKGSDAEYLSISGQKFVNNWLFSGELTQINSNSTHIPRLQSGYASASYQIDNHAFYGVIAKTSASNYHFKDNVKRELFPELVSYIEGEFNFYSSNQKTMSLGWRWDVSPLMTAKLQVNVSKIDPQGATLWINKTENSPGETVTSLMYTLSFAL